MKQADVLLFRDRPKGEADPVNKIMALIEEIAFATMINTEQICQELIATCESEPDFRRGRTPGSERIGDAIIQATIAVNKLMVAYNAPDDSLAKADVSKMNFQHPPRGQES